MCRIVLTVFLLVGLSHVKATGNGAKCNGFNANFDLQKIIGTWYVVAIVPEAMFPDKQKVPCYEVEFSEIEESGLRWLMNMTHIAPHPKDIFDKKGIYIRQRYHSEHSFDVWSKSLEEANGCFQQVLSLNTDLSDIKHALSHEARMQLHMIETGKETGPFLLQVLWGNHITGVIYQKSPVITQEKLKPVSEVMVKLRGPQRTPKLCDKRLKD
ncbi:uncharacterized protein LOC125231254 isoform X2 [Leguminivora glycinivorella]|uniref:uncharacterized protein LOC125231254 isoform X2 n=1 Tax=Leguminivora glycinivorella TaxID=1035111 RepID=UPI00200D7DA7|nr:uncharacterized protein LOC125231254 isoform X2 [Leguminivora glycinivorella]